MRTLALHLVAIFSVIFMIGCGSPQQVHERSLLTAAESNAGSLAAAGYQVFVVDGERQIVAKPDARIVATTMHEAAKAVVVSTNSASHKHVIGIFDQVEEDRLHFQTSAGEWALPFASIEWIEDDRGKQRPEFWLAKQPRTTLACTFLQYHDLDNNVLVLPSDTDTRPLTSENVEPKGPVMATWVGVTLVVL